MNNTTNVGMISAMPPLNLITGEEFVEVIKREANGSFKNYRLLVSKIRNNQGLSAYEVALKNGFIGSEAEWLVSIAGKSAYALALDFGFEGTETEWLESLVGAKGDTGRSAYEVALDNGYNGTEAEYVQSLVGKSAYQVALDNGYNGTEVEWLLTLVGEKGDKGDKGDIGDQGLQGVDGLSAYEVAVANGYEGTETEWLVSIQGTSGKTAYQSAVDGGYEGSEDEFNQSLAEPKGIAGGVFITDLVAVSATENVGDKVKSTDGISLVTCSSTTKNVRVTLLGITGHTNFRPNIHVNGVPATMVAQPDAPLFNGTAVIELPDPVDGEPVIIEALHEDGASSRVAVTFEVAAKVLTGVFTSQYPGSQTELKAGDTQAIRLTTDQPVVAYEIANEGAFVSSSGVLVSGTAHDISGLVIADRGNTANLHGFKVRVKKASGSWSNWFESTTGGSVEKTHVVKLNNLRPSITFGTVTYPAGQTAIAAGQAATVNNTVTDFDTLAYTSTQLTPNNSTVYETAKVVNYLSGTYNDSTKNLVITAQRAANGSTTVKDVLVVIANAKPVINITVPATRLRSGGNHGTQAQNHTITLTSDQSLTSEPALNAPGGNWLDAGWTPNGTKKVWTRRLVVHDNDAKGTFSFNSLSAVGLSGLVQNAINSGDTYVIGGFVFRTLTVAAFPNRGTDIGTEVALTAKLRCTNLSKGGSGSLNYSYQATTDDAVNRYTVTSGNTWYNCDAPNASSNTSGTQRIELEEVV